MQMNFTVERGIMMKRKLIHSVLALTMLLTGCASSPTWDEPRPASETVIFEEGPRPEQIAVQTLFEGLYTYSDGNMTLEFDGIKNYFMTKNGESLGGTYSWDGFTLTLEDETGCTLKGFLTPDGSLVLEGDNNGVFTPISGNTMPTCAVLGRWALPDRETGAVLYADGRMDLIMDGKLRRCRYLAEEGTYHIFADGRQIDRLVQTQDGCMQLESLPDRLLLPVE